MRPREQRFDRIEDNPAGADGAKGVVEADEQRLEVVFARLFDLRAFDPDVFDGQPFPPHEIGQVVTQRAHVLDQIVLGLLERHEQAGLSVPGAVNEELETEEGFSAAGTAAHERRPPFRQPAAGDLIEPFNTGGDFLEISRTRVDVRAVLRRRGRVGMDRR